MVKIEFEQVSLVLKFGLYVTAVSDKTNYQMVLRKWKCVKKLMA